MIDRSCRGPDFFPCLSHLFLIHINKRGLNFSPCPHRPAHWSTNQCMHDPRSHASQNAALAVLGHRQTNLGHKKSCGWRTRWEKERAHGLSTHPRVGCQAPTRRDRLRHVCEQASARRERHGAAFFPRHVGPPALTVLIISSSALWVLSDQRNTPVASPRSGGTGGK